MGGIALGTIVTVGVYHLAHAIGPKEPKEAADGASLVYDAPGMYTESSDEKPDKS